MKGLGTPVSIAAALAIAVAIGVVYAILAASHSARSVTRRFGRAAAHRRR